VVENSQALKKIDRRKVPIGTPALRSLRSLRPAASRRPMWAACGPIDLLALPRLILPTQPNKPRTNQRSSFYLIGM